LLLYQTDCFHHISHDWMLRQVPTDQQVLRKWLQAGYVENRNRFRTEAGTPQVGIISPTLANLTLDGLEPLLAQHFPKGNWQDGKICRPKVNLVR
jgi:RNA-directed DNA polymerase